MALRVDTMNPANMPPQRRISQYLGRKFLLLLLLTIACSLALVLLYRKDLGLPLFVFTYFADSILALVAGLGTRLLLSKRSWLIKTLIVPVLPVAGLACLGYFSNWKLGIDVLVLLDGYVSYEDLAHLVIGITVSMLALWAWRRRRLNEVESQVIEPVRQEVAAHFPRLRTPQTGALRPDIDSSPRIASRLINTSRLLRRPKLVLEQPVRQPRPKRSAAAVRKPQIQLALVEEHRCPYCLEPVKNNDERGVRKCEICHTLHHADCWEVTGMCQVPHLNTKN
ncbi:MAG: hypothetical protein JXA13_04555 [Anaerolineales bacterium]|nr:hypothetical protein [Anaerolineales bacterium]